MSEKLLSCVLVNKLLWKHIFERGTKGGHLDWAGWIHTFMLMHGTTPSPWVFMGNYNYTEFPVGFFVFNKLHLTYYE